MRSAWVSFVVGRPHNLPVMGTFGGTTASIQLFPILHRTGDRGPPTSTSYSPIPINPVPVSPSTLLLRISLGRFQTTRTIKPNIPNRPSPPFPSIVSRIPRIPMAQSALISNSLLVGAPPIRSKLTIAVPPANNTNRAHGVLGRHSLLNNSPPMSTRSIEMALRTEA
jgi:hypothetical protein